MTDSCDSENPHLVNDEFKSDKYAECRPGIVPLSTGDPMAQDLLWIYALRRESKDAKFSAAVFYDLQLKGYVHDGGGESCQNY